MRFRSRQFAWPEGSTFVIQGTVAEDATAGTHVCTLTVTPGAGNEFQVLYSQITDGNTVTGQTILGFITDGTNELARLSANITHTTANQTVAFPTAIATESANSNIPAGPPGPFIVSGTMQLVLRVTTTAVSVTQTFAVVLRVFGANPTATLADTVGTPVLTFNTNAFFG